MIPELFIKGLLIALVTFYTVGRAFLASEATPMVGVASCAAGTFAFVMNCIAAWVRQKVEYSLEKQEAAANKLHIHIRHTACGF